jgi:uncharacterized OsmC-like protein
MTLQHVAAAMQRAEAVLQRRPDMGLHDDSPASARWEHGTRIVASHANGTEVSTDMPSELGGTGDRITPGWLFRAGIASCAVTTIAMSAAAEGVELVALEAVVRSRSDTRGLLGMQDADGGNVGAAPSDIQLVVRIAAPDVPPERLRALVERGCRCSPIPNAVESATPMAVRVEIVDA